MFVCLAIFDKCHFCVVFFRSNSIEEGFLRISFSASVLDTYTEGFKFLEGGPDGI